MAQKLTDLTTSYHSFAKDQILTHDQLNEFLEYFDEQDRLTRICLSGVGITCGFELSTNLTNNHITISKGAGVTTDGDLIHLVKKKEVNGKIQNVVEDNGIIYKYYRAYKGEKVNYNPHFNKLNSTSDFEIIPLIEVVSEQDKQDGDKELLELNLKDKVALFYLECYPKEADNCVTINCDNQGIEQVNKLRVLLVELKDVDRITKNDDLFNSYVTLEAYLDAKTVYVPRIILNDENTINLTTLAAAYQDDVLIRESISNLISGVTVILDRLGRTAQGNQFKNDMVRLFPAVTTATASKVLFQYKYDLLKDLADSYNELKELFLQHYSTCCPDINAFPKHLLLGRLFETEEEVTFRHKFHKSPILLDNEDGNGRFESVLTRMLTMVSSNGFIDRSRFAAETIRITPSNVRVPLGKRAVPFYYQFSDKLMLNWDFDKQNFNRYKSILGYRQAIAYSSVPPIANPLQYTLDAYDFFRIEGHQGYLYDDVFKYLTELKNTFSLPFDIKVLGINVEDFDELMEDQYKCDFKDLNVLLQAWSSEQECIATEVTRVLSSFSTKEPGKNVIESDFYTIKRFYQNVKMDLPQEDSSPLFDEAMLSSKRTFTTDDASLSKTTTSSTERKAVVTNPVLDYINNEEDTVGFYLDQSIKQSNGNYANALAYTMNEIKPLLTQWEDAIVDSTVTLPLQILVSCTALIELIPNSVKELTDATLDAYNVEIEKLCSYTKQIQNMYQNPNLVAKISEKTRSMVSLLVNQLTAICCSSKKLKALLEEVEDRKESILERLNFSKFAADHPGLEHKAGAGPGQTFVLVYVNDPVRRRINSKSGFTKDPSKEIVAENSKSELFFGKIEKSAEKAISIVDNPFGMESVNEIKVISGGTSIANTRKFFGEYETIVRKGAIIADFTLPYLCCSDCAPISFVLPNIPVSLTLSETTYCIDDTHREIELMVSPEDGTVTVVDSIPGVTISGKKLSIDGTIFPEEWLGKVLKFKVDGEETDAELLVSKTPNVDFKLPEPGADRLVKFEVSGDDVPEFSYLWEFGDGMTSTEREPTHDYTDSGLRDEFTVTLTVTGIGAVCPRVVSHILTFVEVTVSVETDMVCEGGDPIPFIISPEGALADITGNGVNEKKTHFDPALVGPGTYPLSYNGKVFTVITVTAKPEITSKIIAKVNDVNLDLSVVATHVESYAWTITLPDGKKRTSVKPNPSIPFDVINQYKAGEVINIQVDVTNNCDTASTEISWVIPDQSDPTAQLEKLYFCNNDKSVYDFKTENFTANTQISGVGVNAAVTPPTFSPMGVAPGEYDITVDGKVVDTVIVFEKPIIEIAEVSSTVNGLIVSTILPAGVSEESLEWKFLEPTAGEVLHPSITGNSAVEVSFSDFTNEKWTAVWIVLSGQAGPCGLVTTDVTFKRPEEVTITLPRYNFCVDDKNSYAFVITPDTGNIVMSGPGVDSTGKSFSPNGLVAGSYTINASNNTSLTVTVYDKPVLEIGTITQTDIGFSASTTLPAGVSLKSVQWKFTNPQTGEELHESIIASTSVNLNYDNFKNEWSEVEITLSAMAGPCGVVADSQIYKRPTQVTVMAQLPRYTFCEGDKGVYDFIFTPNQPMMMSGSGVTATGTAFSPSGLTPGSYTITAENGSQLTVTIVDSRIGILNAPMYSSQDQAVTLSFTPTDRNAPFPSVEWKIGVQTLGDLPGSNDPSYKISLQELGVKPGQTLLYQMTLTNGLCGTREEGDSFLIPESSENCLATMTTELMEIKENAPSQTMTFNFFKEPNDQEEAAALYVLLNDMLKNPSDVSGGLLNVRIANTVGGFLQFLEVKMNEALEKGDDAALTFLSRLYRVAVGMYATAFRCQDQFDFGDFPQGKALNGLLRNHFDTTDQSSLISKGVSVFNSSNVAPFMTLLSEKGATKEPWATIDFIINA